MQNLPSTEKARQLLETILQDGLKAVAPNDALLRHMNLNKNHLLEIDGNAFDLSTGNVKVVGAGKGVAPMAQALENILGNLINDGLVVAKYDHALPMKHIQQMEASHPVPDKAGWDAAKKILELASSCTPNDTLIVLLTGGASALLPAPVDNVTLEDLQKTTSLLLGSGATISEINAIRKHLSKIMGGQLVKAANGAQVISVIVSDVIGDELETIASGPTVGDTTTFKDCLEIIHKYGIADKIPDSVKNYLDAGFAGVAPETPKPDDPIFQRSFISLVATNNQAIEAASKKAAQLGFKPVIIKDPMRGEAELTAKDILENARNIQKTLNKDALPVCLLAGGETTVTLKGGGLGGRNQEMALSAAIELSGSQGIFALFAGTDGTDGPTDAAGGFAFADTAQRMGGLDKARNYLAENNSYAALKQARELLITGPTRTNVMDLAIILIYGVS